MKNNIGKVIKTYEAEFNSAVYFWEKKLIPLIEKAISEFNALNIGDLNEELFREILSGRFETVRIKFLASLNQQMDTMPDILKEMVLQNIEAKFKPLIDAVKTLYRERSGIINNRINAALDWPVDFNHCLLISGAPSLNKDALKKDFELVIINEDQSKLYSYLETIKKEWNRLTEFVLEKGYNTKAHPVTGLNGFFYEDGEGKCQIVPESINNI